jgi:hypothetical protein
MLSLFAVAGIVCLEIGVATGAPLIRAANETISDQGDSVSADFIVIGGECLQCQARVLPLIQ